jgi:hypothetical protein
MPSTASPCPKLNCILVKKNGALKQLSPPLTVMSRENYIVLTETSDSYKDSFRLQTTWKVSKYKVTIELWARTIGRAGQENKYEFPPPADEVLFFGSCLLVLVDSPPQFSLTLDAWKKVYATLFGGFHDLSKTAATDETEYDEMVDIPKKRKTREGYLKDGFIVEDSIQTGSGSSSVSAASSKKLKLRGTDPSKSKRNTVLSSNSTSNSNVYVLPATADTSESQTDEIELEEEPYIDEDEL